MINSIKNFLSHSLSLLLLIFINGIFIFKYGLRWGSFTKVLIIFCIHSIGLILIEKYLPKLLKKYPFVTNSAFWTISVIFFLTTIIINVLVDGNELQVDRWSAMHVGIEALFNGEYPYTAVDHLGGRTSNLPTLLLLGIPFYLLGDVGYLQSFTFLVLVFLFNRSFKDKSTPLVILLLLITSPCYLYEIYVKSDLISNFILVLLFTVFSYSYMRRNLVKNYFGFGLLAGIVFYTRLTAVIPLLLVYFKQFLHWNTKGKLYFVLGGLFGLATLTVLVFINYPSTEVLLEMNPFVLQNRQLPLLLSILYIVIPCFFALRIRTLKRLSLYCVLFLVLPVFTAFILLINQFGFWPAIEDSRFDLSYLNIITPFLIYYIGCRLNSKQRLFTPIRNL